MRRPASPTRRGPGSAIFWDLLTFERLMTNQVIHLIYWAGLGVIALMAFGTVGAAVGVALREQSWIGVMPLFSAAAWIFWPCSSVPVKNQVLSPPDLCQRESVSAAMVV